MQRVFQFGERVGLALSLVLWIAWVVGGAAAAWLSAKFLGPHPLAINVVLLIAVITGTGGLIGYWVVADLVDFRRLSYRVKFVAGSEWLYEERPSRGSVRSFQFPCHILADGYAAHCEVQIPGEALWLEEVPVWAHRRRSEIMDRVAHCLGARAGRRVHFVELSQYGNRTRRRRERDAIYRNSKETLRHGYHRKTV